MDRPTGKRHGMVHSGGSGAGSKNRDQFGLWPYGGEF